MGSEVGISRLEEEDGEEEKNDGNSEVEVPDGKDGETDEVEGEEAGEGGLWVEEEPTKEYTADMNAESNKEIAVVWPS